VSRSLKLWVHNQIVVSLIKFRFTSSWITLDFSSSFYFELLISPWMVQLPLISHRLTMCRTRNQSAPRTKHDRICIHVLLPWIVRMMLLKSDAWMLLVQELEYHHKHSTHCNRQKCQVFDRMLSEAVPQPLVTRSLYSPAAYNSASRKLVNVSSSGIYRIFFILFFIALEKFTSRLVRFRGPSMDLSSSTIP